MATRCRHSLLGLALGVLAVSSASAEQFHGVVLNLATDRGLEAVVVVVRDAAQKRVAGGNTDREGKYSFDVPALPPGAAWIASYEKVHFATFPTVREVKTLGAEQPPVVLTMRNGGSDYYKAVASNYAKRQKDASGDFAGMMAASIAGLPETDKSAVIAHLNAGGDTALVANVQKAEVASQFSMQIFERFKAKGFDNKAVVKAFPNVQGVGSIWLYGSVPTPSDVKAAEEIARSVGEIRILRNDLRVGKM